MKLDDVVGVFLMNGVEGQELMIQVFCDLFAIHEHQGALGLLLGHLDTNRALLDEELLAQVDPDRWSLLLGDVHSFVLLCAGATHVVVGLQDVPHGVVVDVVLA